MTRRFWLIEIWYEYREVFKAIILHSLLFALLLTVIAFSQVLINHLDYPDARKSLFNQISLYGYVTTLIVFVFSSTIKILGFSRAMRRVEGIKEAMLVIAKGNLNEYIYRPSNDETSLLADTFNYMAESLRERFAKDQEAMQFAALARIAAIITQDLKYEIASMSMLANNMEQYMHRAEFRADAIDTLRAVTDKLRYMVRRLNEPLQGPITEAQAFIEQVRLPRLATPTDLVPIIKQTLARTVGQSGQDHEVEARLPASLFAMVNADRIEIVIENIMLNAVEAMNNMKGKLTVEAGTEDTGEVFFSITDTGIGISEEFMRTRLFRPFATTKTSGVGLGLYTSLEVIRAYGGRIDVRSEKNTGTTFRVILPEIESIVP